MREVVNILHIDSINVLQIVHVCWYIHMCVYRCIWIWRFLIGMLPVFFYLQEFRLPTVWFFILPDVTSESLITLVFVIMLHAYDCLILHLPAGPDSCKWCVWQENEKDLSHNWHPSWHFRILWRQYCGCTKGTERTKLFRN